MNIDEAMRRIRLIVPMIRHDVETAILSHEVMEAQNAVVPKGLEGFHVEFVHTYSAIQNALVLKLATDIARVFDFSYSRSPERQDMASIPVLATLFKVEGVKQRLSEAASDWLPGIEAARGNGTVDDAVLEAMRSMEDDHRSHDSQGCVAAIDKFLSVADRLSGDESKEASALERLKSFRNRRLAHALFDKEPDAYPKYADLSLLLETAKEASMLSSLAVEGLNTDFPSQTRLNRDNALGFAESVVHGLKSRSKACAET